MLKVARYIEDRLDGWRLPWLDMSTNRTCGKKTWASLWSNVIWMREGEYETQYLPLI